MLIAGLVLFSSDRVTAQTFTNLYSFTATPFSYHYGTNSDGAGPTGLILSGNTLYGTAPEGGSAGNGTVFRVNTDGTGFTNLHSFTENDAGLGTNSDGEEPTGLILSGNKLYGTATYGGTFGVGTVFAVNTDGTGFENIHSFSGERDGGLPQTALIISGETLYGTTSAGGTSNYGTVFAVNKDGSGFSTLYSFTGESDGSNPQAPLILAGETLYGTTSGGGTWNYGTVFAINTDGTGFTNLYSFADGFAVGSSRAGLLLSENILYGTTQGTPSWGTIFAIATNGTGFTNLHSFTFGDGASPQVGVISSGNILYGTTFYGDANDLGAVFTMTTNGSDFTVLHTFLGYPNDGANPYGSLILSGNTLYGTANGGGSSQSGTIFSLALESDAIHQGSLQVTIGPAGAVSAGAYWQVDAGVYNNSEYTVSNLSVGSVTVSFVPISGWATPPDQTVTITNGVTTPTTATYIEMPTGSLQVTITPRGAIRAGATWEIDGGRPFSSGESVSGLAVGNHTLSFSAVSDWLTPVNQGVTITQGTTTTAVGVYSSPCTSLHSFTTLPPDDPYYDLWPYYPNIDGASPNGLALSGNTLYGAASGGGTFGDGTIFALNTDGTGFRTLYNNSNGIGCSGLLLSNNTLYATQSGYGDGYGSLFKINTDGSGFTILHNFFPSDYGTNSDGMNPNGKLILSGNTLYGTTVNGGTYGWGTVFKVNTDSSGFMSLHSFTFYDGAHPYGGLVLSGNTLYGTAYDGAQQSGTAIEGNGTVFAVNTNGTGFTILHTFTSTFFDPANSDGANPYAGLILSGNTLYGTASRGGSSARGTVFALNTNGTGTNGTGFEVLYSFTNGNDGAFPEADLTLAGNTLFGTTSRLGDSDIAGTVFAINTDGSGFKTLYTFTTLVDILTNISGQTVVIASTNSDGASPNGLIVSGNTLYGTASGGGSSGTGTVFSLLLGSNGAPQGSLRVTITPPTAITNGAQWQVDNGTWQNSGATVANLSADNHTVSFSTVNGWTTPVNQTVFVSANSTTTASGNYVPQTGSLEVTISPVAVVSAGAQWRVDSGTLENSGVTLTNLPVGNHTVSFNTVSGWTTPANQTVVVSANSTATASGTYGTNTGSLQVTISPASAITSGAKWQVDDDGVYENGGVTVTNLSAGSHTVSFAPISGWSTPAARNVMIASGATTKTNGVYVKGNPKLTIASPKGGQSVSNALLLVAGTVTDNVAVDDVYYQLNDGNWTPATPSNSWSNWTASVTLIPGPNAISACALDASGSFSPTNSAIAFYVVTAQVVVTNTGKGTISPDYNGQSLAIGSNYSMTATASTAAGFAFTNWTGGTNLPFSVLTNQPKLTFTMESNLTLIANFVDVAPPSLTITLPTANQRWSNSTFTATGTAKDNVQVSNVLFQLNGAVWTPATPGSATWTNWTATLTPLKSTNLFQAYSVDTTGNKSSLTNVTFLYIPSATLTVRTNGFGGITPVDNGNLLAIGTNYTLTAVPGKNWLFSNWVGGTALPYSVLSTSSNYTFPMESNLVLQANFVTNPFLAVAGVYNGLFYPTNGVTEASSGFISVTVASNSTGAYTAKLLLDGGSNSFSGSFDLTGTAQTNLIRSGKTPVSVTLKLDFNPSDAFMGGSVSSAAAGWKSVICADRADFSASANPATNYAGQFTLLLPPGTNAPVASPGGYGYAAITNTLGGISTLGGALADGTRFLWSVPMAGNGGVPFYQSLYSGKGSLLGWIYFTNEPPQNISANSSVSWIKPSVPNTLYPSGFTNLMAGVLGSPYMNTARAGVPVLNFTNATLILSNGNLKGGALIFTNINSAKNTLTNLAGGTKLGETNYLLLAINTNNGVVTVTFQATGAKTNTIAHGVVLQNQTNAAGYFLGTNQSGAFLLENP
jgi:uncharacterized repeat protein (TIGR03803 family)